MLRPGVKALVNEAHAARLKLGIATTASRSNLNALMLACFSEVERKYFDAVICGEDVDLKQPNLQVYLLCLEKLDVAPGETIAIEDSAIGLAAACAAMIQTIVTPSTYTAEEKFDDALAVLHDLSGGLQRLLSNVKS